jgi:hypothetical protein
MIKYSKRKDTDCDHASTCQLTPTAAQPRVTSFEAVQVLNSTDLDTGSGEIEPVEVHDLVPCGYEVTHEFVLCVAAGVDLRDGP